MSDIHLDARREAEEAYGPEPLLKEERFVTVQDWFSEWIKHKHGLAGYEAAALKYLPQLAEKDKVIEGRDALIARIEQHLKYAKCQTCGGSRKVATPPNENGDRGYRTNIEPCTTCADREELMAAISSLAPTGTR